MRVYRLEFWHPGIARWGGPYGMESEGSDADWPGLDSLLNMSTRHLYLPAEIYERAGVRASQLVHRCPTPQAVIRWFGGYLRGFLAAGGTYAVYDAPPAAVAHADELQVVFDPEQSALRSRCIAAVRQGESSGRGHRSPSQARCPVHQVN